MTAPLPRDTVAHHECGWSSKRTTAGFAAKALRMHSCEKFRREAAEYTRALERERAIDRTPKPCLHPVADHQHGTYSCYTADGCRCVPCAAACSTYTEELNRRNAYGQTPWVDAGPVRARIADLGREGVGLKTIAARTGISQGTLTKLVYGFTRSDGTHRPPSERVRRETADAILAVRPDDRADGVRVDATGTRRRVQALVALGWSVQSIADRSGIDRQILDRLVMGRWFTTGRTVRQVREIYDALSSTTPPETNQRERISASRARRRAEAEGWLLPAWWDDDTIDDPAADPTPEATENAEGSRGTLELTEWVFLVTGGETLERAAARCGVTLSAVEAAIRRSQDEEAARILASARAAA